jgi:hypothetical protein
LQQSTKKQSTKTYNFENEKMENSQKKWYGANAKSSRLNLVSTIQWLTKSQSLLFLEVI